MSRSKLVNLLFAVALIVVALLTFRQVAVTSSVLDANRSGSSAAAAETENMRRSRDADAARWQALGEYYATREAENMQRSRDASAARWQALGEYYAARQAQATPDVTPAQP